MNFYFTAQNEGNVAKAYSPDVLEGNWYEDRCLSEFDLKKKKDYMLPNPNAWQYDTTYNDLGENLKEYPTIKKHFAVSNDNYINFQGMNNKMYVTTNKNAFDEKYRESFRQPLDMKDYYKNRKDDGDKYRMTWTKKPQRFDTTYENDVLSKTIKK